VAAKKIRVLEHVKMEYLGLMQGVQQKMKSKLKLAQFLLVVSRNCSQ
jgi:hypothetical protein